MNKPFSWYLVKMDRIAAWTLLATMFAYFISGYGMTKGIINGPLAVNIHNNWLPLLLIGSFAFHTCYAVSLAFKRWRIWTPTSKFLLFAIYAVFILFLVFINSFYKKPVNTASNTTAVQQQTVESDDDESSTNNATNSSSNTKSSNQATTKTFTLTELAKYNGQNGMPAYVAVSGVVYDGGQWFSGGSHYSHLAGQDLTNQFYSQHSAAFLSSMSVVGKIQ